MILAGNGPLITRDKDNPFYENGAVLYDEKKNSSIIACGNFSDLKKTYPSATILDAHGKTIMPGFINAHHHFYSAFARGFTFPGIAPKEFLTLLKQIWWKLDENLLLEQTEYSAAASCIECIKNGVTTVFDHHASYGAVKGSLSRIYTVVQQAGLRSCLCYEVSDREGSEKMHEAVDENISFIDHTIDENNPMIKALFGLHASFTLSDETLSYIQTVNTHNSGYHVHVAEGLYDEEMCEKKHGMTICQRFQQNGILNNKTIAAHCIHINPEDQTILKNSGAMVVHNPQSNMGNAVGAADICLLMDKGIVCGMGTDGYTSDMTESLKTAQILQKHERKEADRGFVESVKMLFEGNAEIAQRTFNVPVGMLKKGSPADFIFTDYIPYTPLTKDNYNGHIMFGISGAMTDTVVVNGKLLMKNRQLLTIDESAVKKECRRNAADVWKQIEGLK